VEAERTAENTGTVDPEGTRGSIQTQSFLIGQLQSPWFTQNLALEPPCFLKTALLTESP
jgi:hypothetical protein